MRSIATTAGAATLALAACAASGQTMTYFWTVTTDDGDTDVQPGEKAYLSLWGVMDPEQVGFAGSIYDIRGVQNWDTGALESYSNLLHHLGSETIQENNDITGIDAFQLPPLFNPRFIADNPIELYRIIWSTSDDTARVVELGDADHLNNDVYTDDFGSSQSYQGVPGVARFTVNVPAPAAFGVFAAAPLGRGRRRRA